MANGINGKTESLRGEIEELKAQLEKLRTYGAQLLPLITQII